MAQSKDISRRSYPLPAYNFRVTVDGQVMSFAEVSGITVAYESVTYRHGLSFLEGETIKTFRYDPFVPLTLKRGIVPSASPFFLYQWLKAGDSRPLEVSLCDETGTPVLTWRITKAVPVKLSSPAFDASANTVAVESLELQVRGVTIQSGPLGDLDDSAPAGR